MDFAGRESGAYGLVTRRLSSSSSPRLGNPTPRTKHAAIVSECHHDLAKCVPDGAPRTNSTQLEVVKMMK